MVDELNKFGFEPEYVVLESVEINKKTERERYWIAKCYDDGHPLQNIEGFDTYKGKLFFTMKIAPAKNTTATVTAMVTREMKDFIDRLAVENVSNKSDVMRHLLELGVKHYND